MLNHTDIIDSGLHHKIRVKEICWCGNKKLRIYGLLSCPSGNRMKKENQVFFITENEALKMEYRPCGHCLKKKYFKWKNKIKK